MRHSHTITVEVTRGDLVESRHACLAVVADASGVVQESWGDADREIYPRSAIKPIQALPLIETGAADAFGLSEPEVALSCASHMGETMHHEAVRAWLGRVGLSADDLECGAHAPSDEAAAAAVIRDGIDMDRAYNNCSGKHSGFLTTARHLGEATAGYTAADHPVQQRLKAILGELGGSDLDATSRGVDGCGIPVLGMPLAALARAMARMADPDGLPEPRGDAARRIFRAMTTHPEMVRGTHGLDTAIMRAGRGRFATKTGAEGVYIAIVPERKLGIALKVEDGASRASGLAMCALLDHLGFLDDTARAALKDHMTVVIPNAAGRPVGEIRMADGWAG